MITSPQNPRLKLLRALKQGKGRRKHHAFLVEGVRLLEDAHRAGVEIISVMWAQPVSERGQALLQALQAANVPVDETTPQLLAGISDTVTSQNIVAAVNLPKTSLPKTPDFILIPDGIRDPGNLGTLLRTGAAAGLQAVLVPPGNVDPFSPKVVRSGMGAHFRLPILAFGWEAITNWVAQHRLRLYLADMHGDISCWEADFKAPLALIVGGEAFGASERARKMAQGVRIPMPGQMESLNAAVAGSILLFEVVRQRSG